MAGSLGFLYYIPGPAKSDFSHRLHNSDITFEAFDSLSFIQRTLFSATKCLASFNIAPWHAALRDLQYEPYGRSFPTSRIALLKSSAARNDFRTHEQIVTVSHIEFSPHMDLSSSIILSDPTGEIQGSLDHSITERLAEHFRRDSVLHLQNVRASVFLPNPSTGYHLDYEVLSCSPYKARKSVVCFTLIVQTTSNRVSLKTTRPML